MGRQKGSTWARISSNWLKRKQQWNH
jgi:hypothetical protein